MTDFDSDLDLDVDAPDESDGPFVADLDVRFRDLDVMGHVNNAVYVSYLEQARLEYFAAVVDLDVDAPGNVVANLEIDYERSIEIDSDVRVTLWVDRLGETSFRMRYELRDGEETAATATTTQVVVGDDGSPRSVPDEWRERIVAFEGDRVDV
ncbi:acyl-CoA thioesterase, partial [Halobium palmae]